MANHTTNSQPTTTSKVIRRVANTITAGWLVAVMIAPATATLVPSQLIGDAGHSTAAVSESSSAVSTPTATLVPGAASKDRSPLISAVAGIQNAN